MAGSHLKNRSLYCTGNILSITNTENPKNLNKFSMKGKMRMSMLKKSPCILYCILVFSKNK